MGGSYIFYKVRSWNWTSLESGKSDIVYIAEDLNQRCIKWILLLKQAVSLETHPMINLSKKLLAQLLHVLHSVEEPHPCILRQVLWKVPPYLKRSVRWAIPLPDRRGQCRAFWPAQVQPLLNSVLTILSMTTQMYIVSSRRTKSQKSVAYKEDRDGAHSCKKDERKNTSEGVINWGVGV